MTIAVLLVDDHDLIRTVIAAALTATGRVHVVGECADGAAAVTAARELHPDVVLMDVSMPVLDGIEATKRILAEQPSINVLMFTAHTAQHRCAEAITAGAINVLRKDAEITTVVHSVLTAGLSHA